MGTLEIIKKFTSAVKNMSNQVVMERGNELQPERKSVCFCIIYSSAPNPRQQIY